MIRTDIHRPSAINPADYEFVGFECLPKNGDEFSAEAQRIERERIKSHMARTGGKFSSHAHGGVCMVCGNANAIYTAVFHHGPSNDYVRMGQDCAEKVEVHCDPDAFRRFKVALKRERDMRAALTAYGIEDVWEIYCGTGGGYEEYTLRDIVRRLDRYNNLSEAQVRYVRVLIEKIKARRPVTEAVADVPVTNERIEIVGTVISKKQVDTPYGRQWRMLVKADAGFKVFGTVPSSLVFEVNPQVRVKFEAAVSRSKDDTTFGFFNRPTKAEVLS